ncbi:hypothetical protein [Paenibacillus marinisediminis]
MRRPSWPLLVLLLLAGIGLITWITSDPYTLLIPIVLIAIIFAAYKFGPKRGPVKPKIKKSAKTEAKVRAMKSGSNHPPRKTERPRSSADLRLIEGSKSKEKSK